MRVCLNKLQYSHPVKYYADIKNNNSIEKYFISSENAHETKWKSRYYNNLIFGLNHIICKYMYNDICKVTEPNDDNGYL